MRRAAVGLMTAVSASSTRPSLPLSACSRIRAPTLRKKVLRLASGRCARSSNARLRTRRRAASAASFWSIWLRAAAALPSLMPPEDWRRRLRPAGGPRLRRPASQSSRSRSMSGWGASLRARLCKVSAAWRAAARRAPQRQRRAATATRRRRSVAAAAPPAGRQSPPVRATPAFPGLGAPGRPRRCSTACARSGLRASFSVSSRKRPASAANPVCWPPLRR